MKKIFKLIVWSIKIFILQPIIEILILILKGWVSIVRRNK